MSGDDQFDLFAPGSVTVRNDDPQTSYDAAEAIAPHRSKLQARIVSIVGRNGYRGATPWELIEETGVIYNTIWRRLSELKKDRVIVNTDRSRPNDRGFNETVVILKRLADKLR